VTTAERGARTLGELLVTAGVLIALFVAWQLWWTDETAQRALASTTKTLQQQWDQPTAQPDAQPGALVNGQVKAVPMGKAFAIIRIPRFGKRYAKPVYQGYSESILDKGVGHYNHTQMPGQLGNFALAGHRVTYGKPFNEIATIRPGDAIVIETATTWYVYRAVRHVIVSPTDTDVLSAEPEHPGVQPTAAWLTMTACHPEFSAKYRYVEFARLQQTLPKSAGQVPAALAGIRVNG
jgi:sortase A